MRKLIFLSFLLFSLPALSADKTAVANFTRLDTLIPAPQSPVAFRWLVNGVVVHTGTTGTNFLQLSRVVTVQAGDIVRIEMDLVNSEGLSTTYAADSDPVVLPPMAPVPDPGITVSVP